jgi:hypothetical protein
MNETALAPTLAAVLLAGWLMVQAGLGKQMLEWRPPTLRCRSCRRVKQRCRCRRA